MRGIQGWEGEKGHLPFNNQSHFVNTGDVPLTEWQRKYKEVAAINIGGGE